MNSLSDEVNRGFEEALSAHGPAPLERLAGRHPVLSGLSARELVNAIVNERTAPVVRDQLWAAVIESYRQGPRGFWGPLLLQAIAPTLVRKAAGLRDKPDLSDDINHQLIAAILDAAATEKLPSPERWTPNRLATRAVTRTRRWLAAEARSRCVYLSEVPEPAADPEADPNEFAVLLDRIGSWGVSEEVAVVLYRNRVLGEPLAGIADQLGTTEEALQMRRFRAEQRIRRRLTAA